ncbi:MAG TPA: Ig-like domain-containing protein, partial [Ramlibacter sp.]|nr:Ig-like domain-containing protein [Ramlibacter sp.]
MATATSTPLGKVSAIIGKAFLKLPDGQMRELKVGDVIREGDVVVVVGDGRVEIADDAGFIYVARTDEPLTLTGLQASKAERVAEDEIDRIITAVDEGTNSSDAPAAGLSADGAGSGLAPGLRVDRVSESTGAPAAAATTVTSPAEPDDVTVPTAVAGDGPQAQPEDEVPTDTTPPAVTLAAPTLTNDNTPRLSGTSDLPDGSTVTLVVTDSAGAVQTIVVPVVGGAYSADVPSALAEGGYTVEVSARDAAGNSSTVTTGGVVDTTAPALTVDVPVLTNDVSPAITGTTDLPDGAQVTLTVTDSAGAVQTLTATVAGGAYSINVPVAMAEGAFTVVASATDAAGNTATANDSGSLDVTAPTLTVDAPALTNDSTP